MWISGSNTGLVPADGRELWGGDRPVWLAGDAPPLTVRQVRDRERRLAVAGPCLASDRELEAGLDAVRRADWRALTCWPGSYWAVADDGRRTVVLTDVAGTRPVYVTADHDRILWSTRAKPLAARAGAGLDFRALVARLVCPTVREVTGAGSSFVGVERVPGGHLLSVDAQGSAVARYEPYPVPTRFAEAAEALRDALTTAVSARAGKSWLSTDFSGGLDSTSLALLAARLGGRPLLGVTYDDPNSPNDDLAYARRAAATEPLIHHTICTGDARFFDRLDEAPATDQPCADAARWAMRNTYHRVAGEHGSELHLTGSGGDMLLCAPPSYLADLATRREVRRLFRHAAARARLRNIAVHTVLATAIRLARQSYPAAIRDLARQVRNPAAARPAALHWCGRATFADWLTQPARGQLADALIEAAESLRPEPEPLVRQAWNELDEFGAYQAELSIQQAAAGLNPHAPFLDNAVVRAVMAAPIADRQAITKQKPLLGAALRGLVPGFILDRPTKGAYDGNAFAGLRHNARRLRALVDDSQLARAGVIDLDAVRADLDRLLVTGTGPFASLEALITTEMWLADHASAKTTGQVSGHA